MMSIERSKQYIDYINSFDWYFKRRDAIARVGCRCQRCGKADELEVHHLTYERLGDEAPEDLLVVCVACHKREDAARVLRERRKAAERLYEARLDGWATKVYGEYWESDVGYEAAQEAFEEWLERRTEG